jgi:DNA-binding FadR family transcriptional regulator
MSAAAHTPGPWALLDRAEDSRILTHITNGAHIVCTLGTTRTDGSPNHVANAALIAAAPQMLEALCAALEAMGDAYDARDAAGTEGEMLHDQICEAIAKAKGGAK